jgi:hypothetical protein
MDFDACLSFLRIEIDKRIAGRFPVPKGFLEQHVRAESKFGRMLDNELATKLIRHLETIYGTEQENGHSLSKAFKQWYPQRKSEVDFKLYFWRRLHKYWLDHSVLPISVTQSVDDVTDEIIGYLGDPKVQGSWCRRGLVMGHVQSGKTTNYSALITKAADAGYRIIIVLAGITNSLRYQTQIRLDEAFVGKSSLGDDFTSEIYPVSYALRGLEGEGISIRHPFCGTTQSADFNLKTAKSVGASEGNFADPILFVTKKNEKVLARLADWLRGLRQGCQLEGPMLIIDDEADNASINTSKDPKVTTRINERVRDLLQCSRRASYVGYTATPFANIFIDPDTEDEMLKNDLFPEHFIKSLEPPTNYIGAKDLFTEEPSELSQACVKELPEDYRDILPLNHKSSLIVDELPESLKKAVFEYVLVRSIRVLAGDGNKHSSMLINVSRFNLVQQQVHDLIYIIIHQVREQVESWAASDFWDHSTILGDLYKLWNEEFQAYSEFDWAQIKLTLKSAIAPIGIKLVNMKGGGIDYKKAPATGMHIIAVGGLALARGLTLEGLTISYILRNVGAADTLLQIGRWFGYRPNYEFLCRIHATEDMINHFREVSQSVEELRHDLIRMENLKLTPSEFGLKVRHSPTGIAITAANKMRTAKSVKMAVDFSCKHVQASELFDDLAVNKTHREAVDLLVSKLGDKWNENQANEKNALVWRAIDVGLILELLKNLNLPQLNFAVNMDGKSLLSDYISDRQTQELDQWDIAIPFVKSGKSIIPLPYSEEVFCRSRLSGKIVDDTIVKVLAKNVVADPDPTDIRYGEVNIESQAALLREEFPSYTVSQIYLKARTRPLLIIHVFDFKVKDGESQLSNTGDPILSFSFAFPQTNIAAKPRSYAATKRLTQMMEMQRQELDIDEDFDSEE